MNARHDLSVQVMEVSIGNRLGTSKHMVASQLAAAHGDTIIRTCKGREVVSASLFHRDGRRVSDHYVLLHFLGRYCGRLPSSTFRRCYRSRGTPTTRGRLECEARHQGGCIPRSDQGGWVQCRPFQAVSLYQRVTSKPAYWLMTRSRATFWLTYWANALFPTYESLVSHVAKGKLLLLTLGIP